ncbi:hypothetical protein T265_04193 [Opisthorchis viverrini]|uniref:Uncharacterized protein n=1 Tax=Opisthorchis viverrini TaxID=6198 RepID=A0A074ZNY5_OPIVI|nr:hypothetical protein T265_04193 [Opisthorchis viverrini]KER29103.1 hypothetical protein T265_04193 [Opisthorchis viverrini]
MQSVVVNQNCNQPHALMVSTAMENRKETEDLKLSAKKQPTDLKALDELVFQEVTADTISSVSILGKRIVRQYASEFVLPDDTRVAVSRFEATKPSEDHEEVTLSLSIALRLNEQQLAKATAIADRQDDQGTDSGAVTSMSGTSSDEMFTDTSLGMDREHYYGTKYDWENPEHMDFDEAGIGREDIRTWIKHCRTPRGLRIVDYIDDDPWAATILLTNFSANADLLRQLETGCRTEPEAYRMERLQRRRNWETIIDVRREPTVRSIGLSRTHSETDSISTACTNVDEDQ